MFYSITCSTLNTVDLPKPSSTSCFTTTHPNLDQPLQYLPRNVVFDLYSRTGDVGSDAAGVEGDMVWKVVICRGNGVVVFAIVCIF